MKRFPSINWTAILFTISLLIALGCGGSSVGTLDGGTLQLIGNVGNTVRLQSQETVNLTMTIQLTGTMGFPQAVRIVANPDAFEPIPDIPVNPTGNSTSITVPYTLKAKPTNSEVTGTLTAIAISANQSPNSGFTSNTISFAINTASTLTQVQKNYTVTNLGSNNPETMSKTIQISLDEPLNPGEFCQFNVGTAASTKISANITHPATSVELQFPNPDPTSPNLIKTELEVVLLENDSSNNTVALHEVLFNKTAVPIHGRSWIGNFTYNSQPGSIAFSPTVSVKNSVAGVTANSNVTAGGLTIAHPNGTETLPLTPQENESQLTFIASSANYGNVRVRVFSLSQLSMEIAINLFFGTPQQENIVVNAF